MGKTVWQVSLNVFEQIFIEKTQSTKRHRIQINKREDVRLLRNIDDYEQDFEKVMFEVQQSKRNRLLIKYHRGM